MLWNYVYLLFYISSVILTEHQKEVRFKAILNLSNSFLPRNQKLLAFTLVRCLSGCPFLLCFLCVPDRMNTNTS